MINGEYIMVVAPSDYPGKKYRGKYCYEHHLVYWKTYGVVPKSDEIVHHKDEDKHNNTPDNLELIKRKGHSSLHGNKRLNTLVMLKCPGCQQTFVREKRNIFLQKGGTFSCCSRKCIGIVTNLPLEEKQKRISENVIKEFKDDKLKYGL